MNHEITVELISQALDAALMRQTAIANNIANANTQGYQTLEVNFEQQLDAVNLPQDRRLDIHPFYQLSDRPSSVTEQMALNMKNATLYRALIRGLNQKLAIMALALQGNNQS